MAQLIYSLDLSIANACKNTTTNVVDFINYFFFVPKYSNYFAFQLAAIIINYCIKIECENSDFYGINWLAKSIYN